MKDNSAGDNFPARIEDMCALAVKRGRPVYSQFLNDREQYEAERILAGRSGIEAVFWGGNDACARKMLRVSEEESYLPGDMSDFPVYSLTLSFRKADKPGHRDFLGAFMGLGIKRETVGDIFIGEGTAAVFCTKTARDMITDGLGTVGRVGVSVTDGLTEEAVSAVRPASFEEITLTVASERADCVVSGITGLSREKTAAFIRSGGFLLNYAECGDVSRNVSEGDILTVRGHGKFSVSGEAGTTKKGRLKLIIKKYI